VKNPLAAINASAEFLRRHWKVADETEKKEVIELIASETQRINSVITDYLRVRRVPNPTILDYDIADLVDHVERALEQLLKERPEINLQTEVESRELPLDADMVKQVLFNLINNAIDALEEAGGDIVVKGYFQEETGFYELFIRDNGCGMSEETVKRAFEPFYTEKESGTGLGLPMVRQHIDALGGQLDLESEPGEGTTFTIRFAGSAEKENE
jgi:signal transduction histidine kinase